eukprot:COSAG02_NODE_2733_length_8136_cov_35.604454_9_plen_71_part_00
MPALPAALTDSRLVLVDTPNQRAEPLESALLMPREALPAAAVPTLRVRPAIGGGMRIAQPRLSTSYHRSI